MTGYGLLPEGFRRKRYPDIIVSKQALARSLFGENINLEESSPLGLFIRLNAWEEAAIWELAEKVYYSAFVGSAEGVTLDWVAQYIGIERRAAQRATGIVTFEGAATTVIPEGTLVSTPGGVRFSTTEEVIIPTLGEIEAGIIAVDSGVVGNVPQDTITIFVNPISGVNTVTNTEPTSGGRGIETDSEFRERYIRSIAKGGASTIDSIRASILELDGVRGCFVVVNNTDGVVDSRPPHSFEAYVLGGDHEEIALTILRTKAAGIQTHGDITETVEDSAGQPRDISFTEGTEVSITVDVTLTVTPAFPPDGLDLVQTEIVKYIGGEDADGTIYMGLSMAQDVIHSRVIKVIYGAAPGISDMIVGLNGNEANVVIDIGEVAVADHTDITIGT